MGDPEKQIKGRGHSWQLGLNWMRREQYLEARALKSVALPQALSPHVVNWPFPRLSLVMGISTTYSVLAKETLVVVRQQQLPKARSLSPYANPKRDRLAKVGNVFDPALKVAPMKDMEGLEAVGAVAEKYESVRKVLRCQSTQTGGGVGTQLIVKLETQQPVATLLGVRAAVHALPKPLLQLSRAFPVVGGDLVLAAEAQNQRELHWRFSCRWKAKPETPHPYSFRVQEPSPGVLRAELKQQFNIQQTRESSSVVVVGSSMNLPYMRLPQLETPTPTRRKATVAITQPHIDLDYIKLRVRGGRVRWPQDPHDAAVRKRRQIAVVAGHWIDPGSQMGAPGERLFNMRVANSTEARLRKLGWTVQRPDKDAALKNMQWEDYLKWVQAKTRKGVPVLEIHGQGRTAAVRNRQGKLQVVGVIGRRDSIMGQELYEEFGWFPLDWKNYAIPRCGGVLLEGFVTDRVNPLPGWGKHLVAHALACRIVTRIDSTDRRLVRNLEQGTTIVKPGWSSSGVVLRDLIPQ